MLTYTKTDHSVTILGDDFVPKTIPATHPAFSEVVNGLETGNDLKVKQLMDLPNAIVSFMQGRVKIAERTLFYDDKPLRDSLATRILQFMEEGKPELAQPLINFLEKVRRNPSFRAVNGLYDWTVRSKLPITPDGDIIAWKIVNDNYTDCHSGKFDNSVGRTVQVERHEVDEDPDRTCSYGLHFCSTEYLPHFLNWGPNRRLMVVKLDPADVIAFPRDYNISKGRACRYEVLAEIPAEKAADFFPSFVTPYRGYEADNDDEIQPLTEVALDRWYRNREGDYALIETLDDDRGNAYPYEDASGRTYTIHGAYNGEEEHPLDLVELMPVGFEPNDEAPMPSAPRQQGGWLSRIFSAR